MFSSPWHLLLFDRLGVTIIGTLTIIGGKAVAFLKKPIPFLSCHGFQVETTMAASLNFLTANINSHKIQYFIG